jgi:hypothetical protein
MNLSDIIAARRARVAARQDAQRERSAAGVATAVEKRQSRAESIRQLLQDQAERSREAAAEARRERNAQPRGVDRVPGRLRGLHSKGEQLVEHTDSTYAWRRRQSLDTGRKLRPGTNKPAHNPERAERPRGKRRRTTA